jgi:phage gp36-like protein
MAAYATKTDITDRFGATFLAEIADRDGDGSVDDTSVDKALDDATSLIDSYVSAKFDDPQTISPTPSIFIRLCCDIAIYYMARENRGTLSDEIRQGWEDAVEELEKIRDGKISLGIADPPATTGTATQLSTLPRIAQSNQTEGVL